MKLYDLPSDIQDAYERYEQALLDSQGEVTDASEAAATALEVIMRAGVDKIEACAMVIRNLEADATALKEESARLALRQKSAQNNADRIKTLIGKVLPMFGDKVKTQKFTIWNQKNPLSFSVEMSPDTDIQSIAREFPQYVKVQMELRRKEITDAFKSGEAVPSSVVVLTNPETSSVRIR